MKFKVQSPYLSLALGGLQLECWVGMSSSAVLRHPEGTTELLPQLGGKGKGLELAQPAVLLAAVVYQHKHRQHEEGREHAGQHGTYALGGHGPAVDAASKARRVAVGWGPAWVAVAVLVVVADPMVIALLPAAFGFKEGGVPALPLEANMVVATLGPRQHQAWVQHVILLLGTLVDVDAPTLDFSPVYGDGGVDGHSVVLQGPGLRSLTLDLPTLGIPDTALLVFPIHVLPTVPIGVPCHIHPLEAEVVSKPGTGTPQLLALGLVGEAHAVVAVGLAALAGGAVHLVEVGGTVGRLARAELWEVALPGLWAAQRARGHQLTAVTAGAVGTLRPFPQGAIRGIAAGIVTFLFLPTVTLFPFFQVPISASPASVQHLDVWHVRETHPTT